MSSQTKVQRNGARKWTRCTVQVLRGPPPGALLAMKGWRTSDVPGLAVLEGSYWCDFSVIHTASGHSVLDHLDGKRCAMDALRIVAPLGDWTRSAADLKTDAALSESIRRYRREIECKGCIMPPVISEDSSRE